MRLPARLLYFVLPLGAGPALAHHPLAGLPMETGAQGLLSGLAHPVLGFDHLFFVLAAGVATRLAGRGWQVTAVDFAASALQRGAAQAEATGVADRITWLQADLGTGWQPPGTFDLVTVQFLHTPAAATRDAALRAAWAATAGTLLVVAHDPSNLTEGSGGGPPDPAVLYGPAEVLAAIGLASGGPAVVVAETRRRDSTSGNWVDAVVVARRDQPGE